MWEYEKRQVSFFQLQPALYRTGFSRERLQILAPNKRRPSPSKIDHHKLKQYLQQYPDAYLKDIAQESSVRIPAIFYTCKRLKLTLKKRSRSTKKEMKKNDKSFKKH